MTARSLNHLSSPSVAEALLALLAELGVTQAFGVSGGAMAAIWGALARSRIETFHFRHEAGAAFAAIEAHFASCRPTLVFTTTGPGLTNALTGILAARDEGACVVVVSACTSEVRRGRYAIQETSPATLPTELFRDGPLFHLATVLERPDELPALAGRLAAGIARPGGFVAHISIPTGTQQEQVAPFVVPEVAAVPPAPTPAQVAACVDALTSGPIALWVGFGARHAAAEVRALARRLGAPVIASPRAKGIFPEDDELFVGVSGLGGHSSVARALAEARPRRTLVLGTRLGEATSFWDPRLMPTEGFIHVDRDPAVPGRAYAAAPTLAITAEIGAFLRAVLAALPETSAPPPRRLPRPEIASVPPRAEGPVRPEVLMDAIQERIVASSEAIVFSESGNSFIWTTHRLRFAAPRRYRVSTGVGAMGHAAAGVVGAALATRRPSVAVVGDGAMLMNNEINTAVKYAAPAIWIVLNDARYGMCAQGMATLGMSADAELPEVDFVSFARAQGADGVRVDSERDLDAALARALGAAGPFVVDVRIDRDSQAPAAERNRSLVAQAPATSEVSFPPI